MEDDPASGQPRLRFIASCLEDEQRAPMPVSVESITGYVAVTGSPLRLAATALAGATAYVTEVPTAAPARARILSLAARARR